MLGGYLLLVGRSCERTEPIVIQEAGKFLVSRVTLRNLNAGLNILVATPGRLLQHMDETPGFDAGGLQVFVLDEADRILDMVGF